MTVALIDDDAAVLDSLRMLLAKRGIEVECFASADDFLARLGTLDELRQDGLCLVNVDLFHLFVLLGSRN